MTVKLFVECGCVCGNSNFQLFVSILSSKSLLLVGEDKNVGEVWIGTV